jgi:general secretion pathway protein B
MSYILDALKKSDQERQQGTPPHLHSIHSHPPPSKSSGPYRRPAVWVLAAAVLGVSILAGTLFYWLLGHLGDELPVAKSESPQASEQESSPHASTREAQSQPAKIEEPSQSQTSIFRDKKKVLLVKRAVDQIAELPTDKKEQESLEALPFLKDIPYGLQTKIPKLSFAGHTYSKKPSHRMIIINNNILREGDKIAPDTRLVEITWQGVVIDYKTILFRVNVN